MKIEDEIKQKKFSSDYQKAVVNILFTANWLYAQNAQVLKPFGISPEQYNVLRILRGQHPGPASINLIQDRMLDKMSNASRLVEKLRLKKLVERKECKKDRRQVDVVITEKGLEVLKDMDERIRDTEKRFQTLSKEEAITLNKLLDKLRE